MRESEKEKEREKAVKYVSTILFSCISMPKSVGYEEREREREGEGGRTRERGRSEIKE